MRQVSSRTSFHRRTVYAVTSPCRTYGSDSANASARVGAVVTGEHQQGTVVWIGQRSGQEQLATLVGGSGQRQVFLAQGRATLEVVVDELVDQHPAHLQLLRRARLAGKLPTRLPELAAAASQRRSPTCPCARPEQSPDCPMHAGSDLDVLQAAAAPSSTRGRSTPAASPRTSTPRRPRARSTNRCLTSAPTRWRRCACSTTSAVRRRSRRAEPATSGS